MCVLVLLYKVVHGHWLVAGANRDEQLDRPSAPPALEVPSARCTSDSAHRAPAFVAPRDLTAGGTWMGLNRQGLFVALTNRSQARAQPESAASARSRGLLVRDLLACSDARRACDWLVERASSHPYLPYHLVAIDSHRAALATHFGGPSAPRVDPLHPGVHVVGNRDVNDPNDTRVEWIRRAVETSDARDVETWRSRLEQLLGVHRARAVVPAPESAETLPPRQLAASSSDGARDSPCLHLDGYGTRSSAVLALSTGEPRPGQWRWWHADGAPCLTPYEDFTGLLDQLRQPTDEDRGNVQ